MIVIGQIDLCFPVLTFLSLALTGRESQYCVGSLAWRINLGNTCFDIDSVKTAWNKEYIVLSSSLSGARSMLRRVSAIHTRIEIQSSTLCYNYSDRETWSPLTTNVIVWGLHKNRWIVSIRLMALEKTASSLLIGIQCSQSTLVCCTYKVNFHRSQAHEHEHYNPVWV